MVKCIYKKIMTSLKVIIYKKSMPKVTFFYKSKMNEKHEKKDLDCLRFNYKTN